MLRRYCLQRDHPRYPGPFLARITRDARILLTPCDYVILSASEGSNHLSHIRNVVRFFTEPVLGKVEGFR